MQRHDEAGSRLEDDPEMLRVALAMINALDEDEGGNEDSCSLAAELLGPAEQLPFEASEYIRLEANEQRATLETPQWQATTGIDMEATPMAAMAMSAMPGDTPSQCGHRAPKPRRRKQARDRDREEAVYLRNKLAILETQLVALKNQAATAAVDSGMNSQPITAASGAWQKLAERQEQQRRHVELENARLRATLRSQLKIGKSLLRLFQRALDHQEPNMPSSTPERHLADRDTQLPCEERDYRLYSSCLDSIYQQRALMFVAPQFNNGTQEFRNVQLHQESGGQHIGMAFHIGWTLPFAVDRVMDALWRAVHKQAYSQQYYMTEYQPLDTPKGIGVAWYCGRAVEKTDPFHGSFTGSVAIKKYFDSTTSEGVVVIVWDVIFSEDDNKVKLVDESVTRVQCLPQSNGEKARGSDFVSQVHVSRQVRAKWDNEAGYLPRHQVGLMTDFMLSETEKEIAEKQLMIEDLLVRSQAEVSIVKE